MSSLSTRVLTAVILEGFFARLGFGIITFALPFYALSLGMSYTEIGILAALRLVGLIAFKPFMGMAADRFGKKRLYVWSIFGRALVGILLAFASSPLALFAIRFFHGITSAARDPASAILIADNADSKKIATAFSWYATAREVGAAGGYLAAGFLLTLTHDNYPLVFIISTLTSVIALIMVMVFVQEPALKTAEEENAAATLEGNGWRDYFILGLLIALSGSMITQLFPLIAQQFAGLDKADISIIFAISSLVTAAASPFFGWLSDRGSRHLVLSLRSIANSLSSVIFALLPNFWGYTAGRLLDETGRAAFRPAWGALMAEASSHSGKSSRAKTIAYLDTAQSIGEAIGPVFAGLLLDKLGVYWLFGIRFVLAIGVEFYGLYIGHKQRAGKSLRGIPP